MKRLAAVIAVIPLLVSCSDSEDTEQSNSQPRESVAPTQEPGSDRTAAACFKVISPLSSLGNEMLEFGAETSHIFADPEPHIAAIRTASDVLKSLDSQVTVELRPIVATQAQYADDLVAKIEAHQGGPGVDGGAKAVDPTVAAYFVKTQQVNDVCGSDLYTAGGLAVDAASN